MVRKILMDFVISYLKNDAKGCVLLVRRTFLYIALEFIPVRFVGRFLKSF
jgi:hypothetical protein